MRNPSPVQEPEEPSGRQGEKILNKRETYTEYVRKKWKHGNMCEKNAEVGRKRPSLEREGGRSGGMGGKREEIVKEVEGV